jgi:hypothetical protein
VQVKSPGDPRANGIIRSFIGCDSRDTVIHAAPSPISLIGLSFFEIDEYIGYHGESAGSNTFISVMQV